MKIQVKQNNASIMLRNMIFMVVAITLLLGLTTVVAVGHQLLEVANENSVNIVKSLEKTVIDGNHDWKNWRRNSTLDTSTSYVHVQNMRVHAKTKNYYSPDTIDLLKVSPKKVPLIKNLYYRNHVGFLYMVHGHAHGIHYQLWVKLNNQLELLMRVIEVMIVILGLTLLVSPFYIRLVAKRLTAPLTTLTAAAQVAVTDNNDQLIKLPVPDKPTEVQTLALSFNDLLAEVYQQTEREKNFVMNAAHELRTPIATIKSNAQLVLRRSKAHPEIIEKSLGYINEESQQMQTLVDELLVLSRADKVVLPLAPYDISASLTELAQRMQPVLSQKLKLVIPAAIEVTANQDSVNQIVTSLLTNAGKYTPAESLLELRLQVANNSELLVQVVDVGPGIIAADKTKVFDRFYRGADVRGTTNGTGLGLAIAKRLASLNHATLTVTDNQPQGSIFTLAFKH
ncbi:sensor histidine kinase [Lactobacillus sp. CBA3605]|uniref:sensor histidine kinase n=1 Tax=Lactobacillus sp. CBA3605 TaxID=2099788 RepID=UPI000CFE2474|nr:HAMP domain-containing sensor histidine kinase [Lactobacillus sp. CBA3605]AVK61535.1 sensor histidine kinase [Lactobacillus sp. CBA3605]